MERFANKSYYRDDAAWIDIEKIDHRHGNVDGWVRLPFASYRKQFAEAVDSNCRAACFFLHHRVLRKSGHQNCARRHGFKPRRAPGRLETVGANWHKATRDPQSALAKAKWQLSPDRVKQVRSPFLLTMGDHLFDPAIVDLAIHTADPNALNVAVDRKLNAIFDVVDAMKIKTKGDRVVAIGKNLTDYDAIDTGLFVCPPEIFKYLKRAKRDGDCSLADGVRAMAADGKVRAIDIGNAWWQDIDTPEMLTQAEKAVRILNSRRVAFRPRDAATSQKDHRSDRVNKKQMQDPLRQTKCGQNKKS